MTDFMSSREALFQRLEESDFSQRRVAKEAHVCRKRLRAKIEEFGLLELVTQRAQAIHNTPKPKSNERPEATRPPWEYAAWRVREDSLKRDLAAERKINKELAANASIVKATAAIVVPWMEQNMRLPEIKPPKAAVGDKEPIWLLLSINDNHFGAVFSLDIMGQLNAFSPSICAQRVARVSDVVRLWIENYARLGNPVAGIVIAFNGDNFNGALAHEDVNNASRVVKQAGDIAAIHAQMVWEIAQLVPEVVCIGQVGNHTRSSKRSLNSSASASTSWETMYHWSMKAMLKSVPHVKWHIERDRQTYITICGMTWGITHGDLIKGGGGNLGFPAYGLKRHHDGSVAETVVLAKRQVRSLAFNDKMSDEDRLAVLMDAMVGVVDRSLIGHFHTDIRPIPNLHVAPALMGPDPFAKDNLRKGASSPAGQIFWAIHPEQEIMGEHVVHLQHIIEDGPCRYFYGVLEEEDLAPDDMFDKFVASSAA